MTASLRLAVLGDSIAFGMGAANRTETLAARLVDGLEEHGIETTVTVLAVPGARSAGLSAQVDRALPSHPDVAIIVIGANDLTHQEPVREASSSLGRAVRRLRESGAEVVVAPAPDLSSVPWVPAALRPVVREASLRLREAQVAVALDEGARIVDLEGATSQAFAADPRLFSADRFHPSSAGYAVIASATLPALVDAARGVRPQRGGPGQGVGVRPAEHDG